MKKRRLVREALSRVALDMIKASRTNAVRRGMSPTPDSIRDQIESQPNYSKLPYELRSEIEDFLTELPAEQEITDASLARAMDPHRQAATAAEAGEMPRPAGAGGSMELSDVQRVIGNLRSSDPRTFAPTTTGTSQVGGSYSPLSRALLSHGMGSERVDTSYVPVRKSANVMKDVGTAYRKPMDPRGIHAGRSFEKISIPTGEKKRFTAYRKEEERETYVYDVYTDEMVPSRIFDIRNERYGDLIRHGLLPTPDKMRDLRVKRAPRVSESKTVAKIRQIIREELRRAAGR